MKKLASALLGFSCAFFVTTSLAQTSTQSKESHRKLFGLIAPGYTTVKEVHQKLGRCVSFLDTLRNGDGQFSIADCFDIGTSFVELGAEKGVVKFMRLSTKNKPNFIQKNFLSGAQPFNVPQDYLPSLFPISAIDLERALGHQTTGTKALTNRNLYYGKGNYIFPIACKTFEEANPVPFSFKGAYSTKDWVFFHFDAPSLSIQSVYIYSKDQIEAERQAFKAEEKNYFKAQEEKARALENKARAQENNLKNML